VQSFFLLLWKRIKTYDDEDYGRNNFGGYFQLSELLVAVDDSRYSLQAEELVE